jgi:methylenetetrahydrofolate dehydrogenase (NADP+)/methenyltetrahydrofolate cyclohydrolase
MAVVFDGKKFAEWKEARLMGKVSAFKEKGVFPRMVSILVGDDPASKIYLKLKKKASERVGIGMGILEVDESILPQKLIGIINKLNKNKDVHGIMLQLPMPERILDSKSEILNSIDPRKDVDGLTDNSPFVPAVARAVSDIVNFAIKSLACVVKKAVVVGGDGTVGKSVTIELRRLGFKVSPCDKNTRDFYAKLHEADLIVSATGVSDLIKGDMIKEGAIIIDVGAPKGDVSFEDVFKRASFITPVPGGVGPVTVASLLENVVDSAGRQFGL